jgi:hypothetical protein
MQHGEVSHPKQAHLLYQNKIRETVMVSDSDEEKSHASADKKDEDEPYPPL